MKKPGTYRTVLVSIGLDTMRAVKRKYAQWPLRSEVFRLDSIHKEL